MGCPPPCHSLGVRSKQRPRGRRVDRPRQSRDTATWGVLEKAGRAALGRSSPSSGILLVAVDSVQGGEDGTAATLGLAGRGEPVCLKACLCVADVSAASLSCLRREALGTQPPQRHIHRAVSPRATGTEGLLVQAHSVRGSVKAPVGLETPIIPLDRQPLRLSPKVQARGGPPDCPAADPALGTPELQLRGASPRGNKPQLVRPHWVWIEALLGLGQLLPTLLSPGERTPGWALLSCSPVWPVMQQPASLAVELLWSIE